jgi:hypothetical protein
MASPDRYRLKRKTKYISYRDSGAMLGAAGADASTSTGVPVEAQLAALVNVALVMTAGDFHDWFVVLPRDMNPTQPMGIKIRYSTESTTAADTHTWITLYDVIPEDSAIAIGTTALDVPHVAADDTDSGVANAWQWSTRGVINGNTFTEANITNGDLLAINVELDATDAAEEINLHGIQLDYVPKRYQGHPSTFNPALADE